MTTRLIQQQVTEDASTIITRKQRRDHKAPDIKEEDIMLLSAYCCQIFTDFKHSFTGTVNSKFATKHF